MKIKNKRFLIYQYILIYIILSGSTIFIGYQYYKNYKNQFKANIENQLHEVADLKIDGIKFWRNERKGDAAALYRNEVFSEYVNNYFSNPKDEISKRKIQIWLRQFYSGFGYNAVFLTDTLGNKKFIIPELPELPKSDVSPENYDSLRMGKVVFEDFYFNKFKNKAYLKLLIPILNEEKLIAIVELRIDPDKFLNPMLAKWPVPSETAECLILRQDGDSAVLLNKLRFMKESELNLKISLINKKSPAALAASGNKGITEGIDYRGIEVVAYTEKVPGSPWFIVAQMDKSEVYAPLNSKFFEILIFECVISIIILLVLGILWRNNKTQYYKQKAETAEILRESEERFRLLFEDSKDPILLLSDSSITNCNQSAVSMFGFDTKEELLKKSPWEISPEYQPDGNLSLTKAKTFIEKASKTGSHQFEWIHKKSNGDEFPVDIMITKVQIKGETILYSLCRDISDRKRIEKEKQVLHEISNGVNTTKSLDDLFQLIHEALGKIVYAKNCFVALYDENSGFFNFPLFVDKYDSKPESADLSKSCTSYIFHKEVPMLIDNVLFDELKKNNEVELLGTNSPSWVGVPLKISSKVIGVLVLQHYEKENVYSKRDLQFLESVANQIAIVIERKKAEEALRESELKLKVILESTADGILAVNSDGKVIKINKRFVELWKIPNEIENNPNDDILLNFVLNQLSEPDKFISKIRQLYNSKDTDLDHINFKDGRIFERYSMPLIISESEIGRVWSFRDITERVNAVESIKTKNNELSILNAEKDKFFSIIAHDLRSPFNSFLGLTEIMANELHSLSMEEIQKIAVRMEKSAINLFTLLENLLQWARTQQGLIPFNPEIIKIRELLDEISDAIYEPAKIKSIEIEKNISQQINILADSNMLKTILRNLISNAIKFTPEGGKIGISTSLKVEENMTEISIYDNGIGMKKDILDNLFKIDYQTSRKGTNGEPSTGLGLLLCKEFVDKHGGQIKVESEEGKGSKFNICFPISSE